MTATAQEQAKPSSPAPPPHPALLTLEIRLRALLDSIAPDAEVRIEQHGLVAEYQAQKFLVHSQEKDGEFREEPTETVGPTSKGFRLVAYVHPRAERERQGIELPKGPALATTRRAEPDWTTLDTICPLGRSNEDLWFHLSLGSRTDSELRSRLLQTVAASARGFGQSRVEMEQTLANRLNTEVTDGGLSLCTLAEALRTLLPGRGIPYRIDADAFAAEGIDLTKAVIATPPPQREPLGQLLQRLLDLVPAGYTVDGDTVVISPVERKGHAGLENIFHRTDGWRTDKELLPGSAKPLPPLRCLSNHPKICGT